MAKMILAHQHIYDQLSFNFKENRLFPVLLFFGPSGIGKKFVAKELCKSIFCEQEEVCGTCPNCKKIEREDFEGLHILRPDGKFIKVDAIRNLLQSLNLRNIHKARVVIIEQAEKLNPQAANTLLKTFEEPNPNTYFILLSNQVQSLLPTIRSRALPIGFRTLNTNELKQLFPEAPTWAVNASQGRVDLLKSFLESDLAIERKSALDFVQLISEKSKYVAFQKIRDFIKEENNLFYLSFFLQTFFRDVSVLKIDSEKVFFQDQLSLLKRFSHLRTETIDHLFQKSLQIEKQVLGNQDKALVLENFWLDSRRLCANL